MWMGLKDGERQEESRKIKTEKETHEAEKGHLGG